MDAICHNSDGKGHLYNGVDLASSVSERGGCLKSGLDAWPNGAIVTRGILVDMTRLKAAHTPGAAVTVARLEAWEKQTGLRVPRATPCSPTIPVPTARAVRLVAASISPSCRG